MLHARLKRMLLWQRNSALVLGEQSSQVTPFSVLYMSSLLLMHEPHHIIQRDFGMVSIPGHHAPRPRHLLMLEP